MGFTLREGFFKMEFSLVFDVSLKQLSLTCRFELTCRIERAFTVLLIKKKKGVKRKLVHLQVLTLYNIYDSPYLDSFRS